MRTLKTCNIDLLSLAIFSNGLGHAVRENTTLVLLSTGLESESVRDVLSETRSFKIHLHSQEENNH